MMNERELFEASLEIPDTVARKAFLDETCAGQPELRARLEELLESHAAAGEFLAAPVVQPRPAKTTAIDGRDAAASGSAEYDKTQGYTHDAASGGDQLSLDFLSPSDKPGSLGRLAHYEVHKVLGHGAFGIVLKAFDEKLHRMVAIKVLSPELAKTSPPRKRFLREARSAAAIRHEHVVAIHAVEEQPIPYLVMEYIPGITLEQGLDGHGPLDVPDVLRLGQQIAAGLAAAHAQGLIHRDIKPSNILLENGLSGKVKISDFGLARAADDASMTQSGTIAGTPMYMSPEQATSGDIDQRSDLFSLGSVLYVMVSGRPPFRAANTLAVLKRVVDDTPRPIPSIIADTPTWLCAIIAKLQAKQPEDRFATAQEVADLLGRCLADMQANRPVTLPAGMEIAEEKSVAAAAPVNRSAQAMICTPLPPHPRTASSRRWPTIAALAVIALIGLGVTEATGVTKLTSTVIRLTTGSGTLVIETDDPGVKVTIDGEEVSIQGAGVEQLTLKPGQYKIAAVKDGEPVSQQLVTITRGGKEVVRVTMEGIATVSAVSRDPQGSAQADRTAAEWVLSIGGNVTIKESGQERPIETVGSLPDAVFQLTGVRTSAGNSKVIDSEMSRFIGCKNLTALHLNDNAISDAGLIHFKNCTQLTLLSLSGTQVSDVGLSYFKDCKSLGLLHLDNTNVTNTGVAYLKENRSLNALHLKNTKVGDAGVAHFKDCKNLVHLHLSGSLVTDAGLESFKDCKKLAALVLSDTPVSDAGLTYFKNCKNLAHLELSNTTVSDTSLEQLATYPKLGVLSIVKASVTEAGVKKLAAALPNCRIEWDGGVIEPRMSPEREAAEWVLSKGGKVHIECRGEGQLIDAMEKLPERDFQIIIIHLGHLRDVDDEGSEVLANLKHIRSLHVNETSITDRTLAHVQQLKTLEHLSVARTRVTDEGMKHLRELKNLKSLALDNKEIGDEGLAQLSELRNLVDIDLHHCPITDDGMQHLLNFKKLVRIYFLGTQITDKGLVLFQHFGDLRSLDVRGCGKITIPGVKHLASLLPRCRIIYDGGVIEPRESSDGWHGWPADAPKPAIAPFDAAQAKKHQEEWAAYLKVPVEYTNSVGMKFRLIPPGEFLMGSTAEEIEAALKEAPAAYGWPTYIKSESPQHKVILTLPIYLGVNEVTQAEYETVMGTNPSHFAPMGMGKEAVAGMETTDHPVEMVSWNDAAEFCAKLSQQEKLKPAYFRARETITFLNGTGYRLLSEAEWEYACRAGTSTKFWISDKDEDLVQAGWFSRNSRGRTHVVGELKANPYGLYDIHGNVWEWIQDGWEPTYYSQFQETRAINPSGPFFADSKRVLRGSQFGDSASSCRSSDRFAHDPSYRYNSIGFRVALPIDAVRQALKMDGPTMPKRGPSDPPPSKVTPQPDANSYRWPADAPKPAIAPFDAKQANKHQEEWAKYLKVPVEYTNSIGMKFRLIPPGEFLMGSTVEEIEKLLNEVNPTYLGQIKSEGPRHKVILTRPFYLSIHETTQDEYKSIAGANPSFYSATGEGKGFVDGKNTARFPVESVWWDKAVDWCRLLTQKEGFVPAHKNIKGIDTSPKAIAYRLPTEAEWEFACRAGTTTRYLWGDVDSYEKFQAVGWASFNSGDNVTHPVEELKENPFGLFDCYGNVGEWCFDRGKDDAYQQFDQKLAIDPVISASESEAYILRGGCVNWPTYACSSPSRFAYGGGGSYFYMGFRIALSVDAVKQALKLPKSESPTEPPATSDTAKPQPAELVLSHLKGQPFPTQTAATWEPGPKENVIPGLIPRPAKLDGVVRWQIESIAPREGVDPISALSPDHKFVAHVVDSISDSTASCIVRVYDTETGELIQLLPQPAGVTSISWHKDSQQFATGCVDGHVRLWTLDGKCAADWQAHKDYALVAWSPKGEWLATRPSLSSNDSVPVVRLWKPDGTNGPVVTAKKGEGNVTAFGWSRDGLSLAAVIGSQLCFWNSEAEAGTPLDLGAFQIAALDWHPDKKRMVIGGHLKEGGQNFLVVRLLTSGGETLKEHRFSNTGIFMKQLAWSPDGNSFAGAFYQASPARTVFDVGPGANVVLLISTSARRIVFLSLSELHSGRFKQPPGLDRP